MLWVPVDLRIGNIGRSTLSLRAIGLGALKFAFYQSNDICFMSIDGDDQIVDVHQHEIDRIPRRCTVCYHQGIDLPVCRVRSVWEKEKDG